MIAGVFPPPNGGQSVQAPPRSDSSGQFLGRAIKPPISEAVSAPLRGLATALQNLYRPVFLMTFASLALSLVSFFLRLMSATVNGMRTRQLAPPTVPGILKRSVMP